MRCLRAPLSSMARPDAISYDRGSQLNCSCDVEVNYLCFSFPTIRMNFGRSQRLTVSSQTRITSTSPANRCLCATRTFRYFSLIPLARLSSSSFITQEAAQKMQTQTHKNSHKKQQNNNSKKENMIKKYIRCSVNWNPFA